VPTSHKFNAVAFEENLVLREIAPALPDAKLGTHEIHVSLDGGAGDMFVFPFGAVVFRNVEAERREKEMAGFHQARPGLTTRVVREEYTVREDAAVAKTGFAEDGTLVVAKMTAGRANVIALTVAQSAAMEYYERIVESLFARTHALVQRLERHGTVPLRVRPLHRFIGEAIGTRAEVLEVLHLLDKPDAAWDDPAMSFIYDDLRAEFDLVDRYAALESKLRSVQEALELALDVVRDRRLVYLEVAIVVLIIVEIVLSLTKAFA
jgi:uncharacterized Rmd1/YagE family protein